MAKRQILYMHQIWLSADEMYVLRHLLIYGGHDGYDAEVLNLGGTQKTTTILDNLERWGLIVRHPNATPTLYRTTPLGENYFRRT